MRLVWSAFAIQDRALLFDFIAIENPVAAVHCDSEISNQSNLLKDFPEMGRPGRVDGTRELIVQRTPFLLAYRISANEIRILRVLHGAQMWPDTFDN